MAVYTNLASGYLNTTQNPNKKITEITTVLSQLYTLLKTGTISIPILDTTYETLIDGVDLINHAIHTSLSKTENGKKVGYNQIQIISSINSTDRDINLNYISDEYNQELWQLAKIYELLDRNMFYHKLFSHIYVDDIRQYYYNNMIQFTELQPTFFGAYKQKPYIDDDLSLDSSDITIVPYFIAYDILYRLYDVSFTYLSNITTEVQENDLFSDEYILEQFASYITNYKSELSSNLATFIYRNVYGFSNVSPVVDSAVQTQISTLLESLPSMLEDVAIECGLTDLIYTILQDAKHFINQASAMKWLHCSKSGSEFTGGFYENLDKLFNNDMKNYFSLYEDSYDSEVLEYIRYNQDEAYDLDMISKQYNMTPLFFINTFTITFSRMALNLMQNEDLGLFAATDVNTWLSYFELTDNGSFAVNFIKDRHPIYDDNNYTPLQLALYLSVRQILHTFIETDTFETWLISKFIPKLDQKINKIYYSEINYVDQIDKFKTFFKTLFIRDLFELDSTTNKYKLLGNYFSELHAKFKTEVSNTEISLSSVNATNLVTTELSYYTRYYHLFNSFIKSGSVIRYANGVLSEYAL